MNLTFYASETENHGRLLLDLHRELKGKHPAAFFQTFDDFVRWLSEPRAGREEGVFLLLANGQEDLIDFLSIKDLLQEKRIILILPDREQDTVNMGLQLFPRFLTCVDEDFGKVTSVLEKML
jgi:hypothetical protein